MDASTFVDLVSPLMGTRSVREFSRGNTLPLVQRPWAMTAWSLVTGDDPWFFHPDLPKLRGLRATRQSDPASGDYGAFTLCPQTGPPVADPAQRASAYRLDKTVLTPYRLQTELLRYRVAVDLVPTERGALLKLTYTTGGVGRILVEVAEGQVAYDEATGTLRGQSLFKVRGSSQDSAASFLLAFDRPVARWGGEGTLAWVEFDLPRGAVVEVRTASSFLGLDQAQLTLDAEVASRTIEDLAEEGASAWNRLLGRFEVEGGTEEQRRTFYGCLYRTLCFPRKIHEYGKEGRPVHVNFADGSSSPGVLCIDSGFWDTYRTVYPLYALAFRDELGEILEGWIQAARDTGWFPNGPVQGESAFSGTPIDSVIAEAVAKGVTGFDLETAWPALKRHAFESPSSRSFGRIDLEDYLKTGYMPDGKGEHSVSATLDFAYGDWCLSRIAEHLGHTKDGHDLLARSQWWQRLFDASMGFFRPRDTDGSWTEGFDPLAWGGPFAQGSAWQGGWTVPHDPEGLIGALGGVDVALARLDTLLALKPLFQVGTHSEEIHEMTEMALADFGQYAHSIQPSHGILWFYALAGRPDKTERLTRRVLAELYGPGPDGFCGDEDRGEMGAWYVWAALGLYPFCPGSPDYVLGSPLFPKVTVHSGDGRSLVVEAPGNGPDTPVVLKRTLGHVVLLEPRVSQADLFDLGRLVCEMGE